MLHESVRKDPTDVSRRKPRQLRGTPAHRFGHLLVGGFVLSFAALSELYMHSDLSARFKVKVVKVFEKTPGEIERGMIMREPQLWSAAEMLEKRKRGEIEPRVNPA